MHKRLETDLISLAHSILKMKHKEDVFTLKEKSKVIYEKLSLLAFIEEYINTTPNIEETKAGLLSKVEKALALQNSEEKEEVFVEEVEENKVLSLDEELQDTISADKIATLFDAPGPKSLNDTFANIQIGLNDRIAFVKNLFDGSQKDFNSIVFELNTYSSEREAKKFINKMVKPTYDWSEQKELEARFVEIVMRKFA